MNSVLVVMAILGCGDDGTQCQTVRQLDAGYASVEACNAASAVMLESFTELSYPVIMAQCQKQPMPAVAQAEMLPRR